MIIVITDDIASHISLIALLICASLTSSGSLSMPATDYEHQHSGYHYHA
jgi:hypothetical protein